jgi:hypothetical protein
LTWSGNWSNTRYWWKANTEEEWVPVPLSAATCIRQHGDILGVTLNDFIDSACDSVTVWLILCLFWDLTKSYICHTNWKHACSGNFGHFAIWNTLKTSEGWSMKILKAFKCSSNWFRKIDRQIMTYFSHVQMLLVEMWAVTRVEVIKLHSVRGYWIPVISSWW